MSWIKNHALKIILITAAIPNLMLLLSVPIVIFTGQGAFEDWGWISFGLSMLFVVTFLIITSVKESI